MFKKMIIYLFLILPLFVLGACGNKAIGKKNTVINDPIVEANIPYTIRSGFSFSVRSIEMNKIFAQADIHRKLKERTYDIRTSDWGSKLVAMYDNESDRLIDYWELDKFLEKEAFQSLQIGVSTIDDVLKIDPYTNRYELYYGSLSEHRLAEDEVVIITYEQKGENWLVKEIEFISPDPSGFFKTLLNEDLELFY